MLGTNYLNLYNTRKMISSGGASLRSWYQLYSRVYSVVIIPWFESQSPLESTRHATSAKDTNNQQPGSQFGHGMILDILEYSIKALLISCNELENGAVIFN